MRSVDINKCKMLAYREDRMRSMMILETICSHKLKTCIETETVPTRRHTREFEQEGVACTQLACEER